MDFDNNDFAFYYLESKTKNSRKWIMDCQLYDISHDIWTKIINYCISVFRKIYQKIYHDNEYRPDFLEVSQAMELEGLQILKNILYLSDKSQFVKDFKEHIKKCNKYTPTGVDEFNLFTTDKLLKADNQTLNMYDLFPKIFDNINNIQIDELYPIIQK